MAKDPKEYLINALKKATPKLNKLWTETATGYGWDKQIHSQINISADANGVEFNVPEQLADQAHVTEYGLNENPPKAAMRETAAQATPAIEGAGYIALSTMLKDSGIIK